MRVVSEIQRDICRVLYDLRVPGDEQFVCRGAFIAEELGVSLTTVQYHVKKLQRNGVLASCVGRGYWLTMRGLQIARLL